MRDWPVLRAGMLALLDVIDRLTALKPDRPGMMGQGRGGMMTWLALSRTRRIRAAAIFAGPTDLPAGHCARPEMMDVCLRAIKSDREHVIARPAEKSALRFAEVLLR